MGFKNLLTTNTTVLLLIPNHKVTISRLNRIDRQLQPVKLAAGKWAVNWQTTSEAFRISDIRLYILDVHIFTLFLKGCMLKISNNILF